MDDVAEIILEFIKRATCNILNEIHKPTSQYPWQMRVPYQKSDHPSPSVHTQSPTPAPAAPSGRIPKTTVVVPLSSYTMQQGKIYDFTFKGVFKELTII